MSENDIKDLEIDDLTSIESKIEELKEQAEELKLQKEKDEAEKLRQKQLKDEEKKRLAIESERLELERIELERLEKEALVEEAEVEIPNEEALYIIDSSTDKNKECNHNVWRDLEQLSAQYKAENGTRRPATFQFCNKCKIIRIGSEIL